MPDGGERSTSCPSGFTLGKNASVNLTGGRVSYRASLMILEKRKSLAPAGI
jgi:hypothetical protein